MKAVADALFTTEGTRARNAKVAALASALVDVATRDAKRLPFVARFLTGVLLPTEDDRTLGVGGALVFEAACDVTGFTAAELGTLARRAGDLGTAVGEAMESPKPQKEASSSLTTQQRPLDLAQAQTHARALKIEDVEQLATTLVDSNVRAHKLRALTETLTIASPIEARYIVRAVLGEMRVGAREGIVEDAISKAFGRPLADVRAASGFVSDVGELARLAHEDRLNEACVVLGRPIGFMLATPIETARGADLTAPHSIEDKIDGIRAQAHVMQDGSIRLFARGKGSVTNAFPDVVGPLSDAAKRGAITPAILDGEIVVVAKEADGSLGKTPRPFSAIQPRLKKTTPDDSLLQDFPVRYLVYDLMFEGEEALLGLPFTERRERMIRWAANLSSQQPNQATHVLVVHESRPLATAEGTDRNDRKAIDAALDTEFDVARSRGFEGLVLKRLDAVYAAGVRGFSWLKVKKALATLDVVIVAAERGHGRRAHVLSDYTFAVSDPNDDQSPLKTIGKAYSGLTDVEIASLTERLHAIALVDDAERSGAAEAFSGFGGGPKREDEKRGFIPVRPEIVLEVAFDGLQKSDRHSSGFALRFPRIERIRDDKKPDAIDTLDAVKALWDAQLATGHREDLDAATTKTKGGRKSGRRPDVRKKTAIASKQLRLFDDD